MKKLTITRYALTRLTPPIAHFRHWSIIAVLLFIGASNLMAEEVTFSMATKWSKDGNCYKKTESPITVTFSDGCFSENGYIKVPKDKSFSITSTTNTITSVVVTYTAENYSPSKFGKTYNNQMSANVGAVTPKASSTTSTWEGEVSTLKIGWNINGWDLRISQITVTYKDGVTNPPSQITIKKDADVINTAIIYKGSAAQTFSIESDNTEGAISLSGLDGSSLKEGTTAIATVSLSNKTISITPTAVGTASFYINQTAGSGKVSGSTMLTIDVRKHDLTLAYLYDNYTFETNPTGTPCSGQELTATNEAGAQVTLNTLGIQYFSDDVTVAQIDENGAITLPANGTGIATIKAYVQDNSDYNNAIASFTITRPSGISNKIAHNHTPAVNETMTVSNGSEKLLTIYYGGYKYNSSSKDKDGKAKYTDKWEKAKPYTGAGHVQYIDNFKDMSQGGQNAQSENSWKYENSTWNATGGDGTIEWYSDNEFKPNSTTTKYGKYERIKPFSLPVRGAYMKFEPEVSGVLTAYVLQNGILNFKDEPLNEVYGEGDTTSPLAGSPRIYYWADQDGWIVTPTSVTVKQPLTIGIDEGRTSSSELGLIGKALSTWVYGNETMTTSGTGKYKDLETLKSQWKNTEKVNTNLNRVNPDAQPIIHYRGGYLLVQKAYVKYVIPVVAGKSYYFFSNASKLGFAGVNFRHYSPDEKTAKKIVTNSSQTMTPASDNAVTVFKPTGGNLVNTYNTVTLTRTFKQNTWNTICLPFHVTEAQVEKVFGTGTRLVIFDGITKEGGKVKAHLLQHVDQNILAGQPYFIYPTGTDVTMNSNNEIVNPSFTNVSTDTNLRVNSYGNDGSDYKFVGTLSQTMVNPDDYFINASTGKLTKYTGTASNLNTYRAFIQNTSSSAKAITGISFSGTVGDIDDNNMTTGIMEILVNEMNMEVKPVNGVFNLQGQKVSDSTNGLPAGMYIINGKKVAIK